MKRIALLLLTLVCSIMCFAQMEKITKTYVADGKIYEIKGVPEIDYFPKVKIVYKFYIHGESLEENRPAGIIIESEDIAKNVRRWKKYRKLYEEWSKIAKENNVKDFVKAFGKKPVFVYPFYEENGEINETSSLIAAAGFFVDKNGKCTAGFKLTPLLDVRVSIHDGVIIMFSSIEEIDEFIETLSELDPAVMKRKIDYTHKQNSDKDKLFK